MKMTDEQKRQLSQTLWDKLPWMDGVTARLAVGVLDEAGALRVRGREVLPEEIPSGATARVEYDVLTKNHMTGEFVITRHMEITGRKVPDPRSVAVAHEKVANVRYFIVEEPEATLPEQPGRRFKAKTDRGWIEREFVTLVNDKIICVDEQDLTGEVWDRVPFEAAFTVTEVLS